MQQRTITYFRALTFKIPDGVNLSDEDLVIAVERDNNVLEVHDITLLGDERYDITSQDLEVPHEECGGCPDTPAAEEAGQG